MYNLYMLRRNKRLSYYLYFLFVIAQICVSTVVYADIVNGGFEQSEPNDMLDFDPPFGWERENYAAVVGNFVPQPERGNTSNWKIDVEAGLVPFEGQSFVVLSTGDVQPDPMYAEIRQQIEVSTGQRLAGAYFFGTCDYIPFEDYATITLIPDSNSSLRDIILLNINVGDVGSYGSMDGWGLFEYTFSEAEAGTYEIVLLVSDLNDWIFKSYLAVDNVTLCYPPEYGDINRDCQVNMLDFAFMAIDWLNDCSDPNYLSDPNNRCQYGTDINGDGPVDINDLWLMAENWLTGQ